MSAARILVVEDNPANLSLMQYLLQAFGYSVLVARDGAEGVDITHRDRPDLILMDVQMPRMGGIDAARQIRALDAVRRVPIVAVTAFAMVGDRERVLAEGFDGYVSKPINPQTFVTDVEAFIPPAFRAQRRDNRIE